MFTEWAAPSESHFVNERADNLRNVLRHLTRITVNQSRYITPSPNKTVSKTSVSLSTEDITVNPSNLKFQTIQIPKRFSPAGRLSNRGTSVAAGIKLLHKFMIGMNHMAVSHRVSKELENLTPEIQRQLLESETRYKRSSGFVGVLIVCTTMEWKFPDATGTRAQGYLGMHIGGSGTNFRSVLHEYWSQPKITRAAPKGWQEKAAFFWATRN